MTRARSWTSGCWTPGPGIRTDYAVVMDPTTLGPLVDLRPGDDLRLLVACRFGRARLIDNVGAVVG